MTQKEINEFLDNTKVYVNGKSREIQQKLFSLGYFWSSGSQEVRYEEAPFLVLSGKTIMYSDDMKWFAECKHREITAEQILSLELTEPTYRPFNNKEECWEEMLKHEPFGWLTQKGGGYFNPKVVCDKGVMIFVDGDYFPFIHAFDIFLFADGTPFGIKED